MSDALSTIKGMTDQTAAKLKANGVGNTDELVAAALDQNDRRAFATKTGIDVSHLGELVNRADLARIKGIAGVYADMLENAGVDSVKELSHRVPANLQAKLDEVNTQHKMTTRVPNLEMVEDWVSQAKKLAR
ncbi:MAG: DUF4332 domain-containing protein [Chloroflexota bacterium]